MPPPIVISMPKLSDTMEEGGVFNWFFKEGDLVEEGEPLLEIETDKATMEYSSPESGYLRKILEPAGSRVPLGSPIAILTASPDELFDVSGALSSGISLKESQRNEKTEENLEHQNRQKHLRNQIREVPKIDHEAESPHISARTGRLKISPLAKKIAEKNGLNLSTISGSGPHGRIVKKDVEAALAKPLTGSITSAAEASSSRIPLSAMRKSIAQSLAKSKREIPHYYLRSTMDVEALMDFRKQWNNDLKQTNPEGGLKISINDCFIFCVSRALRSHPVVRSFWQQDHILENQDIHIAVAVSVHGGLVTPVIHHADRLSVAETATTSRHLINLALGGPKQRGQLDLTGGTFTISNLGASRVDEFSAVINPPQSAILAIGRIQKELRLDDAGQIYEAAKITVTLSCDHRVIDGKEGADFLGTLARYVENPGLMLLS